MEIKFKMRRSDEIISIKPNLDIERDFVNLEISDEKIGKIIASVLVHLSNRLFGVVLKSMVSNETHEVP
jgi:hypothetical protein